MNKKSVTFMTILALAAGFIGSTLAALPASAVPAEQRMYGSGVHAWLRSSTRVPLVADQRGSGSAFLVLAARTPAVRVLGNADTVFGAGGVAEFDGGAVFDGAIVVQRGLISINGTPGIITGFSTATASVTPTPTNTPTATVTPSPTP